MRTSLRDHPALVSALVAMGARHQGYGVRPEHYAPVGAALLATMAEIGGAVWQDEYTAAWSAAYAVVRDTMLSGVTR